MLHTFIRNIKKDSWSIRLFENLLSNIEITCQLRLRVQCTQSERLKSTTELLCRMCKTYRGDTAMCVECTQYSVDMTSLQHAAKHTHMTPICVERPRYPLEIENA